MTHVPRNRRASIWPLEMVTSVTRHGLERMCMRRYGPHCMISCWGVCSLALSRLLVPPFVGLSCRRYCMCWCVTNSVMTLFLTVSLHSVTTGVNPWTVTQLSPLRPQTSTAVHCCRCVVTRMALAAAPSCAVGPCASTTQDQVRTAVTLESRGELETLDDPTTRLGVTPVRVSDSGIRLGLQH